MVHNIKSNYKPLKCVLHHTKTNLNILIFSKSLWYKKNNTLQTVTFYKNNAHSACASCCITKPKPCIIFMYQHRMGCVCPYKKKKKKKLTFWTHWPSIVHAFSRRGEEVEPRCPAQTHVAYFFPCGVVLLRSFFKTEANFWSSIHLH